ncbi:MAG: Cyclic di-GMP phosphodiesterase response regulator RpfG [Deltaproteobacteria bacterium ADurb.BinA179]|nr:response regulator [Deltaproteobacteria bacterium]MDI9543205.1 response regulator [Pseudomonadota bacterium]OPZ25825.1 MAG: Cyclic di-GMP phosphodiesterase response regulator RpfG [Deltaproteobacteria bacterium ADurb.BinA179]HRT46358.1 response regulator [Desulfomonilia bacterium]HOD70935.1 response regulator [Deltaproteobacteria bacterium]
MSEEILFVDDEDLILDIAEAIFEQQGIPILTARSGEEALDIMKKNEVAVVVSDHHMPGMMGLELLSRIKTISPDTVKILMTGFADLETAMEAINRAEVFRFIVKPWENTQLVKLVLDALRRYRLIKSIVRGDESTMLSLVRALELKDPYTKGHSERVAGYALSIARKLGLSPDVVKAIQYGSWLHDCGKIGVSENILNYEGPLDDAELHIVRNHPIWGADVARQARLADTIVNIILCHHERFDGKGYPAGLKNGDIPLEARIVAVADIYDALTTERPYRNAYSRDKAMEMLVSMKGNMLDPELVDAFSAILAEENSFSGGHQ